MNVQVISMIMLLLLTALGAIGQGMWMLIQPNPRDEMTARVNEHVKKFKRITLPRLQQTQVTLDKLGVMTLKETEIILVGSSDGIDELPIRSYCWQVEASPQDRVFMGASRVGATGASISFAFREKPTEIASQMSGLCSKKLARTRCGLAQCCSDESLTQFCGGIAGKSNYSFIWDPNVTYCRVTDVCGLCEWNGYIKRRCEMFSWKEPEGIWEPTLGNYSTGCEYPFTDSDHDLSSTPVATMQFSLYPHDDIYLLLQNMTYRSMNLGITSAEMRKTALALIAAGSGVLLLGCGAFVAHNVNKNKAEEASQLARARQREEQSKQPSKADARSSGRYGKRDAALSGSDAELGMLGTVPEQSYADGGLEDEEMAPRDKRSKRIGAGRDASGGAPFDLATANVQVNQLQQVQLQQLQQQMINPVNTAPFAAAGRRGVPPGAAPSRGLSPPRGGSAFLLDMGSTPEASLELSNLQRSRPRARGGRGSNGSTPDERALQMPVAAGRKRSGSNGSVGSNHSGGSFSRQSTPNAHYMQSPGSTATGRNVGAASLPLARGSPRGLPQPPQNRSNNNRSGW